MAVLGIDIAKEKFDATRIDEHGEVIYGQFDNCEKGFKQLRIWLNKYANDSLHALLSATNVYWEDLAQFLSELGFKVSVVNPARIKGFAMSQLRRNKTDKLDSLVIAQFCLAMTPKEWVAPTAHLRATTTTSFGTPFTSPDQNSYRAEKPLCDLS